MDNEIGKKRIDELPTIEESISDSALIPISQDNLTRIITIAQLRTSFDSKDVADENKYYTSKTIDAKLEEIYKRINNMETDIMAVNQLFVELRDDVLERYDSIDNQLVSLTEKINTVNSTLNTKIDNAISTLNAKIDNLISIGTTVPTTLESGKVYCQYF